MAFKSFAELLRRAAEYARRGLSEVEARINNRRVPSFEPAFARKRDYGRKGFGARPFGCWHRAHFHSYANSRHRRHHGCHYFRDRMVKAHARFFACMLRGGFYSNLALCKLPQFRTHVAAAFWRPPPVWMASLFGQNHTQVKSFSGAQQPSHAASRTLLRKASGLSLVRLCGQRSMLLQQPPTSVTKPRSLAPNSTFRIRVSTQSGREGSVLLAVSGMWPKDDNFVPVLEPGTHLPSFPGVEATTAALDFELSPSMALPAHAQLDAAATQDIVAALEAQISRLQTMVADVQQLEQLGELPLSIENGGRTLRVHFPNSNSENVALLMQDQEVTSGRIVDLPSDNPTVPPVSHINWQDNGSAPQLSFSISTASTVSESFSLV